MSEGQVTHPAWTWTTVIERLAPAILCLVVVLTGWLALNGETDTDEGFYLAAGQAVLDGKAPIIDFAYTQTPLFPYLVAALMKLGIHSVVGFRFVGALMATAAGLILFLVVRRRQGSIAAVLAIVALGAGLKGLYLLTVLRTFGLTHLVLVGMGAVICSSSAPRTKWLWLVVLGVLAAGSRLTVAPTVAVLWVGCAWNDRAILGWWRIIGYPLIGLAVIFAPFLVLAPERAYFWIWDYHTQNQRDHFPPGYWRTLLEVAPIVMLILPLGLAGFVRTWNSPDSRNVRITFIAAAFGLLLNISVAGNFGEYVAPFIGLALLGGIDLALTAARQATNLIVLLGSCVSIIGSPRQLLSPHDFTSDQAAAVRFIDENIPTDGKILTPVPEVAVMAHRQLLPGMEMGIFSVTTDMDAARADALGLVPYERLLEWTESSIPDALVMCHEADRNFVGSTPSMTLIDLPLQQAFWERVDRNYEARFGNNSYVILLRRPKVDPSPEKTAEESGSTPR